MTNIVTNNVSHRKRGRPALNGQAMTPAERQRRRRSKLREAKDSLPVEWKLRRLVWEFIRGLQFDRDIGELDVQTVRQVIDSVACDFVQADYAIKESGDDKRQYARDVLAGEFFLMFGTKPGGSTLRDAISAIDRAN
jgi:hypothetical protein